MQCGGIRTQHITSSIVAGTVGSSIRIKNLITENKIYSVCILKKEHILEPYRDLEGELVVGTWTVRTYLRG